MKANQKSLVGDERGEINIGIIGVALVLVMGILGLILLVMVSPVLQEKTTELQEKMGINVPDDSQLANTFDASDLVSGIGWGLLLIAAILGGVLLWKYMGS
jgi:hypothetical protein